MGFNEGWVSNAHIDFIYFAYLKVHFLFPISSRGLFLTSISKMIHSSLRAKDSKNKERNWSVEA